MFQSSASSGAKQLNPPLPWEVPQITITTELTTPNDNRTNASHLSAQLPYLYPPGDWTVSGGSGIADVGYRDDYAGKSSVSRNQLQWGQHVSESSNPVEAPPRAVDASHRQRKPRAPCKCPVSGCEQAFTRNFNLKGVFVAVSCRLLNSYQTTRPSPPTQWGETFSVWMAWVWKTI